jgi:hypothetical protein
MTWYGFCESPMPQDGMWDHPTARVRVDAEGGVWVLDDLHSLTDEQVMQPIVEAAMREVEL